MIKSISIAMVCLLCLTVNTHLSQTQLCKHCVDEENQTDQIENTSKSKITANESQESIDLYEKALSLLNRSKPNAQKAYTLLQESAKLNHQKAKELVAKSHLFATHLPFDVEISRKYFESFPTNRSSSAHLFLGLIHSIGLGVDVNQEKALMHYTLAALLDNSLAKMVIAFRHNYGIGVTKSCGKALALYQSVATSVVSDSDAFGGELRESYYLRERNGKQVNDYIDKDLIDYYKFLAKRGDIIAQVSLGQLYYFGGYGVQRDRSRALAYFQRAAKTGNGNALAFLGKMHLEGNYPLQQNYTKALQLFNESTEKGNPVGQSGLGYMYLTGKGVELDFGKAFELFSRSARQGWVDGLLQVGLMYMNGLGVFRDYRMAIKYFTLALKSRHLLVFYNLGQLYASGDGVIKSCPIALHFLKPVAERGVWAEWLTEANEDYKNGRVFQAFMKFSFLSELGYELADSNVAFILENHAIKELSISDKSRHTLALKYWNRSANKGMSFSHIKVGDYHYYGLGTGVDYNLAALHYRKATDLAYSAQALFNLGYLHEKGFGVKKDLGKALSYYSVSAQMDTDAVIPVYFAKEKVKAIIAIESMAKRIDLRQYFGDKWDLVLILILLIILCFAICFKLRSN